MLRDIVFAFRTLKKSPGLVLTTALSLALGVGVNTSFFSLCAATLFRSVSANHPEELVRIEMSSESNASKVSYPNYLFFRETKALTGLVAYRTMEGNWSLKGNSDPERAVLEITSDNFFSELGGKMAYGTPYAKGEARTNPTIVVLGYGFWRRRLGADPQIVGKSLTVNGSLYTIASVLPKNYNAVTGILAPDIYVPASTISDPDVVRRDQAGYNLIGRLAPGVSLAQCRASLINVAKGLEQQFPTENRGLGKWAGVFPVRGVNAFLGGEHVPSGILVFVGVLFGVLFLLLLITCANIAGLLLARGIERRREISVRVALGASRTQLIRQLLMESLVLSLLGAAGGVFLGMVLDKVLERIPFPLPGTIDLQLSTDYRVLLYALLLAIIAAVMAGMWPAFRATRPNLAGTLKGEQAGAGKPRVLARELLVMGQIGATVVLLVSSVIFLQTLQQLSNAEPGFNVNNLLTARVNLDSARHTPEQKVLFFEEARRRISALPGVQAVSVAEIIALAGDAANCHITLHDSTGNTDLYPSLNNVGPEYFATMEIPVVRGREFTTQDIPDAPQVAIINETFAEESFPHTNPIGQQIIYHNGSEGTFSAEIVGVVKNSKYFSPGEPPRQVLYRPFQQARSGNVLHIRVAGAPRSVASGVTRVLAEMDSSAPVEIHTMEENVAAALQPNRIAAIVLGTLGILGLILASVGLCGAMSYSVSRRTREIGIRMALGASRANILRLILRRGLYLSGIGAAVGLLLSLLICRPIAGAISGVELTGFGMYITPVVVVMTMSLVATYPPGRKALKVSPWICIRQD